MLYVPQNMQLCSPNILPEAHLEVIYVADYNKAKDERLLSQSPESLTLKREQKVHPILELAKDVGVKDKDYHVKRKSKSRNYKVCELEQSIDQLVIGSRGLNTFQEMVLGSVSQKVINMLPGDGC